MTHHAWIEIFLRRGFRKITVGGGGGSGPRHICDKLTSYELDFFRGSGPGSPAVLSLSLPKNSVLRNNVNELVNLVNHVYYIHLYTVIGH